MTTAAPTAALPYFNGAVAQHCSLVISVGTTMVPAVNSAAVANPHQQFLIVGATSGTSNVSSLPALATKDTTAEVKAFVMKLQSTGH